MEAEGEEASSGPNAGDELPVSSRRSGESHPDKAVVLTPCTGSKKRDPFEEAIRRYVRATGTEAEQVNEGYDDQAK